MTLTHYIQAQNLACIRGDCRLFKEVSFSLRAGGLLYVLGENGSGKSTLLRLLCGLLTPVSGEIFWDGACVKPMTYATHLLYLGHLNGLKEDLTAIENLLMTAHLSGYSIDEQSALLALRSIGIERCAHLPARVLSQGQKRRVALARLWLNHCALWILDEPFAALDVRSIEVLVARLDEHTRHGGMAIITTHQNVEIQSKLTQILRLGA